MQSSSPSALLVTDRMPFSEVKDALVLDGYEVDLVHSLDAAMRAFSRRVPDLVVAGPFHSYTGVSKVLLKLSERGCRVIVVASDPEVLTQASDLGLEVRRANRALDDAD